MKRSEASLNHQSPNRSDSESDAISNVSDSLEIAGNVKSLETKSSPTGEVIRVERIGTPSRYSRILIILQPKKIL